MTQQPQKKNLKDQKGLFLSTVTKTKMLNTVQMHVLHHQSIFFFSC